MAHAFAHVWALLGEPLPAHELVRRAALAPAGAMALRVVASLPATAGLFRLAQLVAALARQRLWLTDAYYAGTTAYVQALCAAAQDGVDVRLLVPKMLQRCWSAIFSGCMRARVTPNVIE